MGVQRPLRLDQGVSRLTAKPAQHVTRESRSISRRDDSVALKVGQPERRDAVAAEGRAEQREQCLVLGDLQDLTGAGRPPFWRKAEREDSNLSKKWIHKRRPLVS